MQLFWNSQYILIEVTIYMLQVKIIYASYSVEWLLKSFSLFHFFFDFFPQDIKF